MTSTVKNKFLDHFTTLAVKNSTYLSARTAGLKVLNTLGLPSNKDEEYKFTAITKKINQQIDRPEIAGKLDLDSDIVHSHVFPGYEGDLVVFNNGSYDPNLSKVSEQGYSIKLLSSEHSELLGTIAKAEKDPFTALNNLAFEDGISIKVPENQIVKNPILFLFFNAANGGQTISPRILIEIGKHAEVTFLENTVSLDDKVYFSNTVTEIKVAENAHGHYYRLQNENRNALVVNNFDTDVHHNATFSSVVISLQGDMTRNNLTLNLLGSGCEGNMYGLYLLNGKSHVDNHTNVDHTQPHAQSNELYKGILADQSRGVFNGKIFVRQDAQKTNAFQQNNNILLSDEAIVNTKPQLEIWADDVKCSHGCTTGQMDEEALFYLQARGIGKEAAKGLLLYAFAGEVLEHIKIDAFREFITDTVQERLSSNF